MSVVSLIIFPHSLVSLSCYTGVSIYPQCQLLMKLLHGSSRSQQLVSFKVYAVWAVRCNVDHPWVQLPAGCTLPARQSLTSHLGYQTHCRSTLYSSHLYFT